MALPRWRRHWRDITDIEWPFGTCDYVWAGSGCDRLSRQGRAARFLAAAVGDVRRGRPKRTHRSGTRPRAIQKLAQTVVVGHDDGQLQARLSTIDNGVTDHLNARSGVQVARQWPESSVRGTMQATDTK